MPEETVVEFVSKRVERFNALEKTIVAAAADMKELKYQVMQYDAKVKTFEGQILAKKAEISNLDEQIRRKKIEVAGSFNNQRDDISRRELALTKALAELKVAQENTKSRAKTAEELIVKAELAIGRAAEPEKRGPGRPRMTSNV